MSLTVFGDVETVAKTWLGTTSVGPLVTRPDAGLSIFLAMPSSAPLPSIIVRRVGGGPPTLADVPYDRPRISFTCWAASRPQCHTLSATLAAEVQNLGEVGGYDDAGGLRLCSAEVVAWLWLPDAESDTPRYIVDALFAAITI